jgi:hypothetical protein
MSARAPFTAALLASFCGLAIAIITPSAVAILLVGLVPARRDVFWRSFFGRRRLAQYRQNHRKEILLRRRVSNWLGQSTLLLEP